MQKLDRGLAGGVDPLGWDALADLCEERGDLAAADLWRRRAACLRAVLRCRDLAAGGPGPQSLRCPLWFEVALSAYSTRREVRALIVRNEPPLCAVSGEYHMSRASLLGKTQRSPKGGALYLRRTAFGWAEVIS